jgi:hypothetical protein
LTESLTEILIESLTESLTERLNESLTESLTKSLTDTLLRASLENITKLYSANIEQVKSYTTHCFEVEIGLFLSCLGLFDM